MASQNAPDGIPPLLRWTTWLVVPVLGLGVVLLYLLPGQTEALFAWTIASPLTAMFLGAGYAGGVAFFMLGWREHRWHRIGPSLPAIAAFTLVMLLATLLHHDRFHVGRPAYWLWLIVYIAAPPLLAYLWLRDRRLDDGAREPGEGAWPTVVSRLMVAVGLVEGVLALLLFLVPDVAAAHWPWPLTPLTARVLAGWFLLAAILLFRGGRDGRSSVLQLPLKGALVWSTLLLLAYWRGRAELLWDRPLTALLLAGTALSVPVTLWLLRLARSSKGVA